MRHLVVTLSNIGDLVMTTPVIEALHERFPGDAIDIVADRRSSALLEATPYLGTIYHRDKRAGFTEQLALLRRLRRQRYATVVDLRTPFWPWLLRAGQRFVKPRRSKKTHAVEQHFEAVERLLPAHTAGPQRLYLDPSATAAAAQKLAALPGSHWLALAPGANWPGKRWPVSRYEALANHLANEFDGLIVLGSQDDIERPFNSAEINLPVVDLSGHTSLPEVAAVLAQAGAFVGNDSGIGHIASAMQCPCLTVFGPGDPPRYRPWGDNATIIQTPNTDLARLEVDDVAAALTRLLAQD